MKKLQQNSPQRHECTLGLETETRVQQHLERAHELAKVAETAQDQVNAAREELNEEKRRRKEAECKTEDMSEQMRFLRRKYDEIDRMQGDIDEETREHLDKVTHLEAQLTEMKFAYKTLSVK